MFAGSPRAWLPALILVAFVPSRAGAQTSVVRLAQENGGVGLSLDGATVFHQTLAPVRGERVLAVESTPVRVALWEEVGANGVEPFYAIFPNGVQAAVVTPTSYDILMRRARFDPLVAEPNFSDSILGWGGETYIVQFVTQPLFEYQEALRQAGATIYRYVGNHAHLVHMQSDVAARVAALPFVRWIGPYHGEYKLAPELLNGLASQTLQTQRYNIQVFERGLAQKQVVAARIEAMGGTVDAMIADGFLLEATLSPALLRTVTGFDEVVFVDPWGAPEPDLNIARILSGANSLEASTGFNGQGVRAEVMDGGVRSTHAALQHDGGILFHTPNTTDTYHGTSTTGCVFGDGTGNLNGRGILPGGKIVFAAYTLYGNRYTHTAQLVDPSLAYQCVFQSNSWGDPQITYYNNKSFEMDDIIFINDIIICQSQSNTGNQLSRPQAWAKNIVSVGGINHLNTSTKGDDYWSGASIGPAEDGRIKPDVSHFYDWVECTDSGNDFDYQTGFGGTSAATPITAGHFGLFFQMWHNGIFGNPHPGATVFENRPHFTLAKAALINTASQYTFSGANHNLTRTHQGWGLVNVQSLYDRRTATFYVNETDVINNLQTQTYHVNVAAGEPDVRFTLVYRDPAGTVSASQHRYNDLSLKVTEPNGTTFYWGNNGLLAGNYSTSGGNANTKDTVENVIVRLPVAGAWTIEVVGSDINTDIVPSVPGNNATFALWVTGATLECQAPVTYCTAKLTSIGTLPAISSVGTPSFSLNNFVLTVSNGTLNKSGLVFWGNVSAGLPFHGGTLCVGPPHTRGSVVTTDGTGAASYHYQIGASDVGQTKYFQWWMRDPPDAFGDALSNALAVTFCN